MRGAHGGEDEMGRRMPTMSELRAFEAVARHASFTRAGGDLHLTQSAVSRQVASLEEALGARLLVRSAGRIELTGAGADYLAAVRVALSGLDEAGTRVRGRGGAPSRVNVASAPTFATQWLLPRLKRFHAAHPSVEVHFVAYAPSIDFAAPGELDCAILFGEGRVPHADARYLNGRDVVPVARPERVAALGDASAADLAGLTLLQHVEVPRAWADWYEQQGLVAPGRVDAGPRFAQYSMIIRAAADGLGVGLVPRCLIEEPLARGEIATLLDVRATARHGHWLCVPRDRDPTPALGSFSAWLADEARSDA
jgi:DNA-binding transcriptional LysR family regulator